MAIFGKIDNLGDALRELRAAEHDVMMDFGEDAVEAGYSDLIESIAADCTPDIAKELKRIKLGV